MSVLAPHKKEGDVYEWADYGFGDTQVPWVDISARTRENIVRALDSMGAISLQTIDRR